VVGVSEGGGGHCENQTKILPSTISSDSKTAGGEMFRAVVNEKFTDAGLFSRSCAK